MEKKKTLLIQEDIIILKILERLILSKAYSCKAIRSLDELDIEDQSIFFDFIISDILFDGIAPLEFIDQVQEIIRHDKMVVVTNMGQENVKADILAMSGVSGFFSVPFNLDEIEILIDNDT